MSDNGLFKNPPLVEVIAEIHWALPRQGASGGGDPQWFSVASQMTNWARGEGFAHVEELVPAGVTVPLDMLGRAPILRLRQAPNSWPVIQLGQGLLTINAVPPYDGWDRAIAPLLVKALKAAHENDPRREKDLPVAQIELRYVDALTKAHGVAEPQTYLLSEISMVPKLPETWAAIQSDSEQAQFSGEYKFKLKTPDDTHAFVKYGSGSIGSEAAALLTFIVRSNPKTAMTADQVSTWFEAAHVACRALLNGMLSDRVRKEVQ